MGKFVVKETNTGVKFDLKAGNGEVIATSEVYFSKAACLKGIASVQKNAPVAGIEDQTGQTILHHKILHSLYFLRIQALLPAGKHAQTHGKENRSDNLKYRYHFIHYDSSFQFFVKTGI